MPGQTRRGRQRPAREGGVYAASVLAGRAGPGGRRPSLVPGTADADPAAVLTGLGDREADAHPVKHDGRAGRDGGTRVGAGAGDGNGDGDDFADRLHAGFGVVGDGGLDVRASIRAAILSGELEPGARLPSGEELAKFFGVTRVTVGNAIRTLREEGFVRSKTGSGVYVRDQTSLPVPGETDHPLAGVAAFLFEMGHLKRVPAPGGCSWAFLSPRPLPSTASGSASSAWPWPRWKAPTSAAPAMCLLHDAHETRIGDVPSVGRAYVTTAAPEAVSGHQTAGMPDVTAKAFQELTAEFEAAKTIQVARDADKLETWLQAVEYQAQGHDMTAWQETSIAALRTDAARQLAQAIMAADPQWWSAFAASYRELRASAIGRTRNLRN